MTTRRISNPVALLRWPGPGRDWRQVEGQGDLGGDYCTWHERAEGPGGRFGVMVVEGHSITNPNRKVGGSVYQAKRYAVIVVGEPGAKGLSEAHEMVRCEPGRRYAQVNRDMVRMVLALADGRLTELEACYRWSRAEAVQR